MALENAHKQDPSQSHKKVKQKTLIKSHGPRVALVNNSTSSILNNLCAETQFGWINSTYHRTFADTCFHADRHIVHDGIVYIPPKDWKPVSQRYYRSPHNKTRHHGPGSKPGQ